MSAEWAVNTPGGQVRLGDFDLDVVIDLEAKSGEEWWKTAAHPFRKAAIAKLVYEAACAHNGSTPARLVMRDLVATFEQVDDDLPEVFEGGIPKSEVAPETTGSSGAPSDTDGHQTSSADNP